MPRFRGRRPDVRAEVDEELAFHLEMRVRDLVAASLSPSAARLAAERDFGDVGAVRAQCVTIDERRSRRDRRAEYVGDLLNDLRFAARALRKAPGFALTALLCVALGVAVTTTIFSAVHGVLVRPLPFRDADRLVAVYAQYPAHGEHGSNISYPDYESWRDETRALDGLAIWTSHALSGAGGDAERVEGAAIAAALLPTLGVRPRLGRTLVAAEAVPGRDRVALLSHGLWQRRYGGDPAIVGRTITVDARPYEVVEVMPRGFNFPDRGQLWVPFARRAFPGEDPIGKRVRYGSDAWLTVVGVIGDYRHYRLPQPMGPAMYAPYAAAPTSSQTLAIRTSHPDPLAPAVRAAARVLDADVPLHQVQTLAQQVGRSLWRQRMQGQVLGAFAALALTLAVVGIYGVVSYAVARRTRELGVRMAIGASRRQVVRLVLGQGARLALAGVALGWVGALALSRVVESLLHGVDSLDPLTFVAVPALLCAVALLACLVPARRATRVDPLIAMRAE